MFKHKKILVTGGTGMIGRPLVEMLLDAGAEVRVASLDDKRRCPKGAEFYQGDLTNQFFCQEVVMGMDYVFHLAGIKGSPAMSSKRPASFFVPTILFNTNMMEAARLAKVERYLYTSSIGVYAPADILYEDDVWESFPSVNDRFPGWAKRTGELQAEAYRIEYGWKGISIVRPANVYGPYDNFDPDNAMVIPSLISRAMNGENPLVVWGDGSAIRDFIHARDVARGMMICMEKAPGQAVNLGSGYPISIKQIVDIIISNMETKPDVVWDTSKPLGDRVRVMDTSRAREFGFYPAVYIETGIKETMEWYRNNRAIVNNRYNIFKEVDNE